MIGESLSERERERENLMILLYRKAMDRSYPIWENIVAAVRSDLVLFFLSLIENGKFFDSFDFISTSMRVPQSC